MNKKTLAVGASLLGIILIVIAFIYWFTPAGSLPHFFPGYIAGATGKHFKHGILALVIGLVLFAYAWFVSGTKSSSHYK